MYPSTKTRSGLPTSTETATLDIASSTSSSVKKNNFTTTIQSILGEFKKYIKNVTTKITVQDENIDNITTTITDQDAKFDNIKK